MKFDIENVLYIIVIIVWVVMGFLRKKKKKEGRPASSMPPVGGENDQPDFSEMLEEILGKKREEQKAIPVQPKPLAVKAVKKKAMEEESLETITGTDFTKRSISKGQTISTPFAKQPRKDLLKPKTVRDSLQKETLKPLFSSSQFDLRNAVILSEILNPPYK